MHCGPIFLLYWRLMCFCVALCVLCLLWVHNGERLCLLPFSTSIYPKVIWHNAASFPDLKKKTKLNSNSETFKIMMASSLDLIRPFNPPAKCRPLFHLSLPRFFFLSQVNNASTHIYRDLYIKSVPFPPLCLALLLVLHKARLPHHNRHLQLHRHLKRSHLYSVSCVCCFFPFCTCVCQRPWESVSNGPSFYYTAWLPINI